MKKIIILFTILALYFDAQAQTPRWNYLWDTKAHNQGQIHFSYGYGIPRLENRLFKLHKDDANYRVVGVGPFAFKAEYGLTRQLSIGLSAYYIRYTSDWKENRFDSSLHQTVLPFVFGTKVQDISVMLRLNYHYNVTERTDVYLGGAMGYNKWIVEDFTTYSFEDSTFNSNFKTPGPFAAELTAGFRYFFRSRNALYLEVGYGKSIVQAGFVFKFRAHKKSSTF